jgi:hypothetical protein
MLFKCDLRVFFVFFLGDRYDKQFEEGFRDIIDTAETASPM